MRIARLHVHPLRIFDSREDTGLCNKKIILKLDRPDNLYQGGNNGRIYSFHRSEFNTWSGLPSLWEFNLCYISESMQKWP